MKKFKDYKKEVVKERVKENFLTLYIFRQISTKISYFLLNKFPKINGNHITSLSFIIAMIGLSLFSLESAIFWIGGCILIILFHILDCVDGELSRFQKKSSIMGGTYDNLVHDYVNAFFFFWAGIGLYNYLKNVYFIYFSSLIIISILLFNIILLSIKLGNPKYSKDLSKKMQIKNLKNSHLTIKEVLFSFFGFLGLHFIVLIASILDLVLSSHYFRLTIYIFTGIYIIIAHFEILIKFIKLVFKIQKNNNSN